MAEAYAKAVDALRAGEADAAAAKLRNDDAVQTASDLETAKNTAVKARDDALAEITKEKLWRSWRYCELGTSVTDADLDGKSNWWELLEGVVEEPSNCIVPAVPGANDGDPDIRGAVTYYFTYADLPNGVETETARWSAHAVHVKAAADEDAASSGTDIGAGTDPRTQAGKVAWLTGSLVAKTFVWQ